jgi:hypothetical protein
VFLPPCLPFALDVSRLIFHSFFPRLKSGASELGPAKAGTVKKADSGGEYPAFLNCSSFAPEVKSYGFDRGISNGLP